MPTQHEEKPKILYTDDEGALSQEPIQTYLKAQYIQHHRKGAHANFFERRSELLRTCYIGELWLTRKGENKIQWTDYIHEMLLTYNIQMKHSATGFTPKEARKPNNEISVRLNIASSGTRNRIYPEIAKGDEVEISRKRKPNEKERIGNWNKDVYTREITEQKLNQSDYYVEGVDRPYLTLELLRAEYSFELNVLETCIEEYVVFIYRQNITSTGGGVFYFPNVGFGCLFS